jgi:hypothetical protein
MGVVEALIRAGADLNLQDKVCVLYVLFLTGTVRRVRTTCIHVIVAVRAYILCLRVLTRSVTLSMPLCSHYARE